MYAEHLRETHAGSVVAATVSVSYYQAGLVNSVGLVLLVSGMALPLTILLPPLP